MSEFEEVAREATLEDLEDTWTTRELADYYGVPIQTVSVAAKRGQIPGAHKVLGRYVFEKGRALEWIPAARNPKALAQLEKGPGGKFKEGNAFGVGTRGGRPKREFELAFLSTLVDTVSPEDWEEIIVQAVEQAKEGDWRARQWLSNYLIGTPVRRVEVGGEVSSRHEFEIGERAAAIRALLEQARERESVEVVDVTARPA